MQTQVDIAAADQLVVVKRDGSTVEFDPTKIETAIKNAYLDVEGLKKPGARVHPTSVPARINEQAQALTDRVVKALLRRISYTNTVHIEEIQDLVELSLMRAGEHKVARSYVLYREEHARRRKQSEKAAAPEPVLRYDTGEPLDLQQIEQTIESACGDDLPDVSAHAVLEQLKGMLHDGISYPEVMDAMILAARGMLENEPDYSHVAARLLLLKTGGEVWQALGRNGRATTLEELESSYPALLPSYLDKGIGAGLLDPKLREFDLERVAVALYPQRDRSFDYLGMQTLADRYLLHEDGVRFELPQLLLMRVAMGLSLNEDDPTTRAIEFYEVLSSLRYMTATPTLFNSGTTRPQLSSCYLNTVPDDLSGIFGAIKDNAMLSKYAGGLGNDWTRVRGLGALIKGTNGKSQGVIPFLKVANDTTVAVNQGGRRRGACCAYLETWHIDIEEFLELRKNTGDERRRTHDMNTANWVPDLFMKRVEERSHWTLFSPEEVTDLHEKYGTAFEEAYLAYEAKAERGEIRNWKRVDAFELWKKMLGMLFETGHPWITFKDPCNIRSPQSHVGVVHSSNLCTEITLNTSDDEIAVCNLGSVNLYRHLSDGGFDWGGLRGTVHAAMRMLDNVIDINYYSVEKARQANLRHRPVGLGVMGWQDCLQYLDIPFDSPRAVELADELMEHISYYAIEASILLAEERGPYPSFQGSAWSHGKMPIDTLEEMEAERGMHIEVDRTVRLDWMRLETRVREVGIRNSNCLAIAPTATIANIVGVSPSIEPTYKNLYVKSNLSGEFTVVNHLLVGRLKERGLWDPVMVNDLKYYDGELSDIDRIPDDLKRLFKTAFEIEPTWLIRQAAVRQKWLDQSQSLNLYMAEPSGPKVDAMYREAWKAGLKTTYYLRTLGATGMEKTTVPETTPKICSLNPNDGECEVCQ